VLHVVYLAGWPGDITMGHSLNFENEQASSPITEYLKAYVYWLFAKTSLAVVLRQ
jgi:hypothetical protein